MSFICRLSLTLVFLAAVAGKLRGRGDLARFRAAVGEFGVAPRWSSAVSGAVIAGELVSASLMLIDATAPVGLGLAAMLLAAFTGAIGSAVRRGATTSCRCFGASDQPLGVRHVVRNVILLSVAAAGMAGTLLASGGLDVTAMLLSGFVAVVLATLVIAYDDLVALILVR